MLLETALIIYFSCKYFQDVRTVNLCPAFIDVKIEVNIGKGMASEISEKLGRHQNTN
jgi:hypothetical protein